MMDGSNLTRKIEVILKVSDLCNLRCRYCFDAPQREQGTTLNSTTISSLTKIFSELAKNYDEIEVIFHGGEPFTASPMIFLSVMDVLDPFKVVYHIQTNLASYSLEAYDAVLQRITGLSFTVDGPEKLHDLQRVCADGSGSYSRIVRNLEWLHSQYPNLHMGVLCTLSTQSISFRTELYGFFKSLGVPRIGFNPVFNNEISLSNEGYYQILDVLFDEWIADPNPLDISLFVEALKWVTAIQESPTFCYGQSCFSNIISISPKGHINPCLHWHDDGSFLVQKFVSFEPYLKYYEQKFANFMFKECLACQFWTFCRGGCPHEYFRGKWYFCEAVKWFLTKVQGYTAEATRAAVSRSDKR